MKIVLLILFLALTTHVPAQVGINTLEPQQKLHVAGATENVRVEGLNKPNNTNNLGAESTTRVFVDANGDLVLATTSQQPFEIMVDAENYIKDGFNTGIGGNEIIQTGTGLGYSQAGMPRELSTAIFTLTKPAIVEVNYSISWTIQKNANNRINDGHARIFQTGLYFRKKQPDDGPLAILTWEPVGSHYSIDNNNSERADLIALNGQFYTNGGDKSHGAYKDFQNTGTDYIKLDEGTYVALFVGRLAVIASGAMKVYLGEGVEDNLQIIAHYYE